MDEVCCTEASSEAFEVCSNLRGKVSKDNNICCIALCRTLHCRVLSILLKASGSELGIRYFRLFCKWNGCLVLVVVVFYVILFKKEARGYIAVFIDKKKNTFTVCLLYKRMFLNVWKKKNCSSFLLYFRVCKGLTLCKARFAARDFLQMIGK